MGGTITKKRRRPVHLHVMVSEEEQVLIWERMVEAGIRSMGTYMWKMILNGYVFHIGLSSVRGLVLLQRWYSNNFNQVAIQANTYGGTYPEETKGLQRGYEKPWGPPPDLLKKLFTIVECQPRRGAVWSFPDFYYFGIIRPEGVVYSQKYGIL